MATDPVLIHAGNAAIAARKYGVSAADILGILSVEGGTSATGQPVAPGDGAGPPSFGQFTFGTGRALGVKFGDSASETDAIARYLVQLGYHKDRTRAIAAYNGGPGNPQYGYAAKVLNAAKRYAGAGAGASSSATPTTTAAPGATDTPAASSSGELFGQDKRSDLLKALLWVSLAAAGTALAGIGLKQSLGAGAT